MKEPRPGFKGVRPAPQPSVQDGQDPVEPAPLRENQFGVYLFWLPLGAGGHLVRLNGRLYEAIKARREHRRPSPLFHTALEVMLPESRYVVEQAWPIRDVNGWARGVVVEGPVWSRHIGGIRLFRYEVRCWRDGTIPDGRYAVGSPVQVSDDPDAARRLLELAPSVPAPVWGRDECGTGEMWNSNSVVSWLLARSGIPTDRIVPPLGGRAPGWDAGLQIADRGLPLLTRAASPRLSRFADVEGSRSTAGTALLKPYERSTR